MKIRLVAILCLVAVTVGAARSRDKQSESAQRAVAKIAPWVLEHAKDGKQTDFLVVLADKADLSGAALLKTKREKGRFVYDALWSNARKTQQSLLSWLESGNIEHRSYYIVNMIWVRADLSVALSLAARSEVAHIAGNPVIHNDVQQPLAAQAQTPSEVQTIEANLTNTRAPEVWGLGYKGQGVVVAGADTGYRWDHITLKPQYRGWNGTAAAHDFNWHDSIHSGGGTCGPNSAQPCDDNGHGTHTMGTAVGDDGATNQIGMAPSAKWIGCRNMDQGSGTPASYIECMEFFLAPYPVNGSPAQGDPAKAPDITTNSWTCPASEGCAPATLQQAVEAQRAAGIMMVVAAGNSGPSCSTVGEPPSFYDASYSVGAFDHRTNLIAGFSSRGPITIDGSSRLKPDITAPGVSIRSAWKTSTSAFNTISGTSMATPHVAGAVALLWSAQPALRGNVLFAEQILNNAAVHVPSTSCSSNGVPNNTYGYGRLDIKAAVDAALPCTSSPTLSATQSSFPASGGSGNVNVISVTGCGWIAESQANFITITVGASGSGNASVTFSVAANGGPARTGTMTIAGQTFTVTQPAAVRIDGVIPPAGRVTGGQQIKLAGSFDNLSTVAIGGVSVTWSYTSGTIEVTLTTPPHAVGAVNIDLMPTTGSPYTRSNAFAYLPAVFTDDTLVAGVTTAKAQHIIELRQAIDALRAVAGLGPAPWTDPGLPPFNTTIKAVHILELRSYLEDAAARLGYPAGSYTDPGLTPGFVIMRLHIEDLRQRVRNIAG